MRIKRSVYAHIVLYKSLRSECCEKTLVWIKKKFRSFIQLENGLNVSLHSSCAQITQIAQKKNNNNNLKKSFVKYDILHVAL